MTGCAGGPGCSSRSSTPCRAQGPVQKAAASATTAQRSAGATSSRKSSASSRARSSRSPRNRSRRRVSPARMPPTSGSRSGSIRPSASASAYPCSAVRGAQVVGDGEQELPLPVLAARQRRVQDVEGAPDVRGLPGAVDRGRYAAFAVGQPMRDLRGLHERTGDAAGQERSGQCRAEHADDQRRHHVAADLVRVLGDDRVRLGQHDRAAAHAGLPHQQHVLAAQDAGGGDRLAGQQSRFRRPVDGRGGGSAHRAVRGDDRELHVVRPTQYLGAAEKGFGQGRQTTEHRCLTRQLVAFTLLRAVRGGLPGDQPGQRHRERRHHGGQHHDVACEGAPARTAGPGAAHVPGAIALYPTPRTVRIGLASPSLARSCETKTSTIRVSR